MSPLEYQVRDDIICNCSFCSNDLENDTIIEEAKGIKWEKGQKYDDVCCHIRTETFIIVMVTIFGIIIIVLVIILCWYKKKKEKEAPNKRPDGMFDHPYGNPIKTP